MIIDEATMLHTIAKAKKLCLIEPEWARRYVPLGLAKIDTYAKRKGVKSISYTRIYTESCHDVVCITTLFTFHLQNVLDSIAQVKFFNPKAKIIVGGICASLMPKRMPEDVMVYCGCSLVLDSCVPDYKYRNWQLEEKWRDFSFLFTERGCPNKCGYCAVWRLEPGVNIIPNWREHIVDEKPCVALLDNNLSAMPMQHIDDVTGYLEERGKGVTIESGLDCKRITPKMASFFARLKLNSDGMRLAFDRIEEDGVFQKACRTLQDAGVNPNNMMAYVLYNFNDTPQEATYRAREVLKLGMRVYPQQYEPLNETSRDTRYISKYWSKTLQSVWRDYWLFRGYYATRTFEEYVNSKECDWVMTPKDWELYHFQRKK
jgi:hypothetical protein